MSKNEEGLSAVDGGAASFGTGRALSDAWAPVRVRRPMTLVGPARIYARGFFRIMRWLPVQPRN